MRAITLVKSLPAAVGALVALWVLPNLHGQEQSLSALAELHLPIPEHRLSGSGTEGSTPILHESVKLTASDAGAEDEFGRSISMSSPSKTSRN